MNTGIVLAGGKSSRMGSDKCILEHNNSTFIQNAITLISSVSDDILLSTNNSEFMKFGYQIVPDLFSGIGPLSGIYSSLLKSKTEINIIIPCDLPNISVELLNFLLSNIGEFDAVIPVFDHKVEPLVGVYKKGVLPFIEKSINDKEYKILTMLKNANTLFIPITSSNSFYNTNLFKNINTIDDYKEILDK